MVTTKHYELPRLIDYCLEILDKIKVEVFKECLNVNGYCILKDEKRLYIASTLTETEKFIILIEALSLFDLENIFINPVIRDYIQRYRENRLTADLFSKPAKIKRLRKKYIPKPFVIRKEQ